MSQLIMNAVMAEANAKEAKAIANLQVYMSNPAGIGEHPDVVAEVTKLVHDISAAREIKATVQAIVDANQPPADNKINNKGE